MSGGGDRPETRGLEGPLHRMVPEGDERERLVCLDCGFVNYANPKVVTGSVAVWHPSGATGGEGERILLCRRAIAPQAGLWTLPAGYLELGESTEEGAVREAREEACADIAVDRLLAVYNVVRISQVQTIYRARLRVPDTAAGEESLEVALFRWEEIPWEAIAFPTVRWALGHWYETRRRDDFPPFGNPEGESANVTSGGL